MPVRSVVGELEKSLLTVCAVIKSSSVQRRWAGRLQSVDASAFSRESESPPPHPHLLSE